MFVYIVDKGSGPYFKVSDKIKEMIMKDKAEAIKMLKECDEFYLTIIKDGKKSGIWNFEDYTTLIGTLEVAREWFKNQVLKQF